ncbi:MalY/PatB family protein [Thalassobacillus sp. C254]|uniref:MalY/PatB family protein n=1 Tax=Thalassobacillus sp. C254 TaxID=1225341 RepID=UPI0006D12092|nr:MalY/PatB family protein [Thalassobacillus sp. C254]
MNFDEVFERKQTNSMKWDLLKERYQSEDLWPMWVADMDFQAPPPVLDAMRQVVDHGIFGYHARPDSLREVTAGWLKKRFKWEVQKEDFVFTPGVVPAISHLIKTFTAKGDQVIIQTPVYYPFYSLIKNSERTLVKNPLKETDDGFVMDLDDLEEKMKAGARMLLLCSPHNPIGRVWKKEELRKVGELAEKYNVLVVSDEIHADLILKGEHVPFAKVNNDLDVSVITCMAPSKTFNLAALQLSYVIFQDSEERTLYEKHLSNEFVGIDNPFATVAAEAAYLHGEPWLEALLEYIKGNVELVKQDIETNMPKIKVVEPEGTYLIWLDFREFGMSGLELQEWLRKEGNLALSDGHIFGPEGSGFARMNLACPKSHVEEGLRRLNQAYNSYKVK